MIRSVKDCGNGVWTRIQSSRLQVKVPYKEEWIVFAHSLQGRWRRRTGIWSFPRYRYPRVAEALNRIFGTSLHFREDETGD